jgi:hypothetical protein
MIDKIMTIVLVTAATIGIVGLIEALINIARSQT